MKLDLKDAKDVIKNKDYVKRLFKEFLLSEYSQQIAEIVNSDFINFVEIHYSSLCDFNMKFAHFVIIYPSLVFNIFDEVLMSIVEEKLPNRSHHYSVRLAGLPTLPEVYRVYVPTVKDVTRLIAFRCCVSKCGIVQVIESTKYFKCNLCKHTMPATRDFCQYNAINMPSACKNPSGSCPSEKFQEVQKNLICVTNYQEIKVIERVHCLIVGVVPQSITVCLEDSLVDTVKPGDDIIVNGIVKQRWKPLKLGKPCLIELVIQANSIENYSEMKSSAMNISTSYKIRETFKNYWNSSKDCMVLKKNLIDSMFPSIYGMFLVKLSLALLCAAVHNSSDDSSGNERFSPACSKVRESPHILLVGDPGVAKSAMMRSVANVCQRVVLTTATGSTAAGLTAAASRDRSGVSLEPGALVQADLGVCCVDEFTALSAAESAAVHEAMEQQTLSFAKAGILASLNTRCSVLAAANPVCIRKVAGARRAVNALGIKSSLLSRFDLVYLLYDPVGVENWDKNVTKFVLQSGGCNEKEENFWNNELLSQYFVYIKEEFQPIVTIECSEVLKQYYVWRRQNSSDTLTEYGRNTPRMLESLFRLTKCHARLMSREETSLIDAFYAILLMHLSISSLEEVGDANYHLMSENPNCHDLIKRVLQAFSPGCVPVFEKMVEENHDSETIWNPQSSFDLRDDKNDAVCIDSKFNMEENKNTRFIDNGNPSQVTTEELPINQIHKKRDEVNADFNKIEVPNTLVEANLNVVPETTRPRLNADATLRNNKEVIVKKRKSMLSSFELSDELLDDALKMSECIFDTKNKNEKNMKSTLEINSPSTSEKISASRFLSPEKPRGKNSTSQISQNKITAQSKSTGQNNHNRMFGKDEMYSLLDDFDDNENVSLCKRLREEDSNSNIICTQNSDLKQVLMSCISTPPQIESPLTQQTLKLFDSDSD